MREFIINLLLGALLCAIVAVSVLMGASLMRDSEPECERNYWGECVEGSGK